MMKFFQSARQSAAAPHLVSPQARDEKYGEYPKTNVAQYLLDLNSNRAVFNFCGSIPFELRISAKLKEHLEGVAAAAAKEGGSAEQPVIFDWQKQRMAHIPDYNKTAKADNVTVFHGREVRESEDAAGGKGCVLHLSFCAQDGTAADPEGWTAAEASDYDGWGHDGQRHWRKGPEYEAEGFTSYRKIFGPKAYGLHHRFYLHFDKKNAMWLSAEDGCEGEPW